MDTSSLQQLSPSTAGQGHRAGSPSSRILSLCPPFVPTQAGDLARRIEAEQRARRVAEREDEFHDVERFLADRQTFFT